MNAESAPALESIDSASFIAQMRPALVSFFQRRCGNAAEAEDLAQEVIARALAHSGWTSAEKAKGYIFRIGVNLWRDRRRRQISHGATVVWDDQAALAVSEERSPERVLVAEDELHRIAAALLELNERTRDVFVLHRLEQMKQAEIATLMGVSVSCVEKHITKALAHLARRIDRSDR